MGLWGRVPRERAEYSLHPGMSVITLVLFVHVFDSLLRPCAGGTLRADTGQGLNESHNATRHAYRNRLY